MKGPPFDSFSLNSCRFTEKVSSASLTVVCTLRIASLRHGTCSYAHTLHCFLHAIPKLAYKEIPLYSIPWLCPREVMAKVLRHSEHFAI